MADGTIDLGSVRAKAAKARTAAEAPAPVRLDPLEEAVASITLIAAAQAEMGRLVCLLQQEVTEQKVQIARLIEVNRAMVRMIRPAQPEGNPDDDDD